MAYATVIEDIERKSKVTLHGTVSRGDLLAHDGTGWVKADANYASTQLYAQFVALDSGVSGDVINACKGCTIEDLDAPWTANQTLYVSETAGEFTATRPTTAAAVIQVVGRSISTTKVRIDIKPPEEKEVLIAPCTYDSTTEPGIGVVDNPAWVGPAIDSTNEAAYFQGVVPSNAISLSLARVLWNSIGETTITVAGATIMVASGATNTGVTGSFTAAAPTGLADNKICYSDITAALLIRAGYLFSVKMSETGASAGDLQAIGLLMRYVCV